MTPTPPAPLPAPETLGTSQCRNLSPPGWSGHWREWHRGHGCELDPENAAAPNVLTASWVKEEGNTPEARAAVRVPDVAPPLPAPSAAAVYSGPPGGEGDVGRGRPRDSAVNDAGPATGTPTARGSSPLPAPSPATAADPLCNECQGSGRVEDGRHPCPDCGAPAPLPAAPLDNWGSTHRGPRFDGRCLRHGEVNCPSCLAYALGDARAEVARLAAARPPGTLPEDEVAVPVAFHRALLGICIEAGEVVDRLKGQDVVQRLANALDIAAGPAAPAAREGVADMHVFTDESEWYVAETLDEALAEQRKLCGFKEKDQDREYWGQVADDAPLTINMGEDGEPGCAGWEDCECFPTTEQKENARLRAALASETERREEAERLRQSAWDEGFKDGQVRAERRCEDLRGALADVVSGMPDHCTGSRGNAPGHGHRVPGIWDDDNGAKAGTACEWCATWRRVVALSAALSGASSPAESECPVLFTEGFAQGFLSAVREAALLGATSVVAHLVAYHERMHHGTGEPCGCADLHDLLAAPSEATPTEPAVERGHSRGCKRSMCDQGMWCPEQHKAHAAAEERGSGEVLGTCGTTHLFPGRGRPHTRSVYCNDWQPLAAPSPGAAGAERLARCPATPDGRLPPDEIADCEFCPRDGTTYCAGDVDEPPPELEPRRCFRVAESDDSEGVLCAQPYGDPVNVRALVTCGKCLALLADRAPGTAGKGEP